MSEVTKVVIVGAAGRDFHNFNVVYRDDAAFDVVAFTAAQIPDIAGRRYPPALAGPRYPAGIPIVPETELEEVCRSRGVDLVVFAYSDVPHAHVMHVASRALAAGADFALLGPDRTMLRASVPVIAVSAVRTGCGKSQTARWISRRLRSRGLRVAVIRHPMPYGDLERQAVQRFADRADLAAGALHGRGARGVRAASRGRQRRVRRRRLRAHRRGGAGRGRHHRLGRRQQRLPVHPPGSAHRPRRSAASRRRDRASSRRSRRCAWPTSS